MKTNIYSIEIANIVKQFLTEDSWNFSFDEEHGIFKFGLRIKGKIHSLKYFISIRTNEIIVYGNMALVLHQLFLLKVMHKKPLQCVRRNMRKNFTVYFLK